jgi:alpha-L-rhamnosidase
MNRKYALSAVFITVILAVLPAVLASCKDENVKVDDMRCELMTEPDNVDVPGPRFSWNFSGKGDFLMSSFRILVSGSMDSIKAGVGDMWDSNVIKGDVGRAAYGGVKSLQPYRRYFWSVCCYDSTGAKVSSDIASFRMAPISRYDWGGSVWISDSNDKDFKPAPLFRKTFEITDSVAEAQVYISAVGVYELYLNGERVGDRYLEPAYTSYDKRVYYSTYDVTSMLKPGKNTFAAVLGNVYYNMQSQSNWEFDKASWRDRPKMILRMYGSYKNGARIAIPSNTSWKTATGGYAYNSIYTGDRYDRKGEIAGWKSEGFDDSAWADAVEVKAPAPYLESQKMPPMRLDYELNPVDVKRFGDSVVVFDFGENVTGFCRLTVRGKDGARVDIAHGELLKPDGRLEQGNINIYFTAADQKFEAVQTDTYMIGGDSLQTWTPSFNYHGFRYAEVRSSEPLDSVALTAIYFHTDLQRIGHFRCSDSTLNRLYDVTMHTYLNNLHGIPTDCPQREKNGWTADAYLAIDLGLLNYDGELFYEKWLQDIADCQRPEGNIPGIVPSSGWGYADWIGPVWDAVMFLIPQAMYEYTGSPRGISQAYPICTQYLKYLKAREDADGTVTYGIGDWVPWKTQTPTDYTTTCFYYNDLKLYAKFSDVLGFLPDSALAAKTAKLRDFINAKYFNASDCTYSNGSQDASAVALAFGIVPEGFEQKVADKLAKMIEGNGSHFDSGVMGSKLIPRMLAKYGYGDLALKMALQPDAPSFAYWMKEGLTTLPETWTMNPQFKDASLDHIFFGDFAGAWLTTNLAGIRTDPERPGFRHFFIKPFYTKSVDWAKADYKSDAGYIASSWKRTGHNMELTVTVPPNTVATVSADKEYEVSGCTRTFRWREK